LILYDISKGFDTARIILADSARLSFTEDKTHLYLQLFQGEMFENLRDQSFGKNAAKNMPFRRESFPRKNSYILFDANFNRMDDSVMREQYVGKNVAELRTSIDSIGARVDSLGDIYGNEIKRRQYFGLAYSATTAQQTDVARNNATAAIDIDSLFYSSPANARTYLNLALAKAKRQKQDFEYKTLILKEEAKLMRRHDIEFQRRFTLPVACLVFFFVGAPLGAIIKKGGIGTPLVISVFLFIVYFIFDNMGYKMSRDGKIPVWEGIWLSSAVMLPLGIFVTYKAVGDSAVFNADAYTAFFNRIRGRRPKRTLSLKEVVITEVEPASAIAMIDTLSQTDSMTPETTNRLNTLIDYL
ncbi:MAG: LptF/LptG family permease, partial [Muribaculaceae bacterium]|nr:LptF/LptG family permease [Muribaculaceae bacterium]